MTNYSVNNVDEFIQASKEEARPHLDQIRSTVKQAIPEADEKIGYGKPYYKTSHWLVGFDVYTHHIGFEIYEGQLSAEIRTLLNELGYKTGNKTFQIRYDQKVPKSVITKLAKSQAEVAKAKVKS